MSWFTTLTGVNEVNSAQVRSQLSVSTGRLTSSVNGKSWACGELEVVSLQQLRERIRPLNGLSSGRLSLREVVADSQTLHQDMANTDALFQVASQFNLLEMVSPEITPDQGIGRYDDDRTQGPACAIAAGAGTIYRQYFVPLDGQNGQSAGRQIDCLADVGVCLGNTDNQLWTMKNGYMLPSASGLSVINQHLCSLNEAEKDQIRQQLKVGIQWHTQVTLPNCQHRVSQIYCSALPVTYARYCPLSEWRSFAQLILEAAYEATLCTAMLNAQATGNRTVYLTLLGGGAFGNPLSWIIAAMQRALLPFQNTNLEVVIVSYGQSNPMLQTWIQTYCNEKKNR